MVHNSIINQNEVIEGCDSLIDFLEKEKKKCEKAITTELKSLKDMSSQAKKEFLDLQPGPTKNGSMKQFKPCRKKRR